MLSPRKYEDDVAMSTGIGMSAIGRRLMIDPLWLAADACETAIADAGLTFADIDGLATYPGEARLGRHVEGTSPPRTPAHPRRPGTTAAAGTAGPAGSIIGGHATISAGWRATCCASTVWQATFAQYLREGNSGAGRSRQQDGGRGAVTGPSQWRAPYGLGSAAINLAMPASPLPPVATPHRDAGVDRHQQPGQRRPEPQGGLPRSITMDDYLSARMIDPSACSAAACRRRLHAVIVSAAAADTATAGAGGGGGLQLTERVA